MRNSTSVVDIFSRKIIAAEVHEVKDSDNASEMITRACAVEGISADQLDLHSDNGSPLKGCDDAGNAAAAWCHAVLQPAKRER